MNKKDLHYLGATHKSCIPQKGALQIMQRAF
jgi:hypothetical protein